MAIPKELQEKLNFLAQHMREELAAFFPDAVVSCTPTRGEIRVKANYKEVKTSKPRKARQKARTRRATS